MLVYKNSHVKADIAQLVELLICNQWVGSSSLSVGTIKKASPAEVFFMVIDINSSNSREREDDDERKAGVERR